MMRDQGKEHFACVLFLTYYDPNKKVTQISEKGWCYLRTRNATQKSGEKDLTWEEYSEIESQIRKIAAFSIWNVFQMKELIKESKSADCKN